MKFRNNNNTREHIRKGEKNKSHSMTIPDQSMSVRELLVRHVKGIPLPDTMRPSYYDEDEPTADFTRMDLAEQEEYYRNAKENLSEQKQLQKQRKKEKEDAEKKAAEEKNTNNP